MKLSWADDLVEKAFVVQARVLDFGSPEPIRLVSKHLQSWHYNSEMGSRGRRISASLKAT